jgi:hypothetical protein
VLQNIAIACFKSRPIFASHLVFAGTYVDLEDSKKGDLTPPIGVVKYRPNGTGCSADQPSEVTEGSRWHGGVMFIPPRPVYSGLSGPHPAIHLTVFVLDSF